MVISGVLATLAIGGLIWVLGKKDREIQRLSARLTYIEGDVTVFGNDGSSRPATLGESVTGGMRFRTAEGAEMDIGLPGIGGLKLDGDTVLETQQWNEDEEGAIEVELKVDRGRVFHRLHDLESGSNFQLTTPSGQMVVRGTEFFIEISEESDATLVATREGEVTTASAGDPANEVSVGSEKMVSVGTTSLGAVEEVGERERELFQKIDEIKEEVGAGGAPVVILPPESGEPWENTMGMRFVPLVNRPNKRISVRPTLVAEFKQFVDETDYGAGPRWQSPGFDQTGRHPVIFVDFRGAKAFCEWLTDRERQAGVIGDDATYVIPTKEDWVALASQGLGEPFSFGEFRESRASTRASFSTVPYETETSSVLDFGAGAPESPVSEWTDTWLLPQGDRTENFLIVRDCRGVAWRNSAGAPTYSGARGNSRLEHLGFRVMLYRYSEEDLAVRQRVDNALEQLEAINQASRPVEARVSIRDGKITLIFARQRLTDLSPLQNLPIRNLGIFGVGVRDLSPLRGMPIELLQIGFNSITDLDPLRGMPLRMIDGQQMLGQGKRDLEPVAECPLEYICPGAYSTNVTLLAGIPTLQTINFGTRQVLRVPLEMIQAGRLDQALGFLEEFGETFETTDLLEEECKTVLAMAALRRWVVGGKQGAPPGAERTDVGWSMEFPDLPRSENRSGFDRTLAETLAGFLGGSAVHSTSSGEDLGHFGLEWEAPP